MTDLPREPLTDADAVRLRSAALFVPLPREALAALLGEACAAVAEPFRVLFEQDQPADHLVVVIEGVVGVMAAVGPHESCLVELIGPGQVVGEAGLFDTGRYPVAAQAITGARLALIPAAALRECLDTHAGLRRHMLGFLSSRLRVLVQQIAQLKLMSAPQRVGSFLLGLTQRRAGRQTIRLACERRIIAGMLGMTPESLSRSLRQLRDLGVQSQGKRDILVEDPERLRAFVAGITE